MNLIAEKSKHQIGKKTLYNSDSINAGERKKRRNTLVNLVAL